MDTAPPPPIKPRQFLSEKEDGSTSEPDVNHNTTTTTPTKPSTNFLNIHYSGGSGDKSPSSTTTDKPFIPPLDLSILHEHGEGSGELLKNILVNEYFCPS